MSVSELSMVVSVVEAPPRLAVTMMQVLTFGMRTAGMDCRIRSPILQRARLTAFRDGA